MKRIASALVSILASLALGFGLVTPAANAAPVQTKSAVSQVAKAPAKAKSAKAAPKVTKHGVKLQKDGRVIFINKTGVKISTKWELANAKRNAKRFNTSVGFEQDIRGCEIQYSGKANRYKLSDCINVTIKFHKMYV